MCSSDLADRGVGAWALAGLLAGLAMLSKYHGVFVLAGTAGFLVTTPRFRRLLATPGPWIGTAIALACFVPVVVWNRDHHWASFAFQGARAAPRAGLHPDTMLANIGGQMAWVLPWIFIPLAASAWRALRAGPRDERRWFLLSLATGPIVGFTLVALKGDVGLPHWQAPGWLFVFPLLGAAVAERLAAGHAGTRRWLRWSIGGYVGLIAVLGLLLAPAVWAMRGDGEKISGTQSGGAAAIVGASVLSRSSAERAFDRSLQDEASALAAKVTWSDRGPLLDVSRQTLELLTWDKADRNAFAMVDLDGYPLAGDATVPVPADRSHSYARPLLFDAQFHGEPVRGAVFSVTSPMLDRMVSIVVVETRRKRSDVVRELQLGIVLPLVALGLVTFALIGWGVGRALQPLRDVGNEVALQIGRAHV